MADKKVDSDGYVYEKDWLSGEYRRKENFWGGQVRETDFFGQPQKAQRAETWWGGEVKSERGRRLYEPKGGGGGSSASAGDAAGGLGCIIGLLLVGVFWWISFCWRKPKIGLPITAAVLLIWLLSSAGGQSGVAAGSNRPAVVPTYPNRRATAEAAGLLPTNTPRPTRSASQATSTPRPEPTRIPTLVRPTAKPSPTATAKVSHNETVDPAAIAETKPFPLPQPSCANEPHGLFYNVWVRYQTQLGCPLQGEPLTGNFVEQPFEGGHMFWFAQIDLAFVTVGGDQGEWALYQEHWAEGGPPESCTVEAPPGGRFQPLRGFGWIWCNDQPIRDRLGWAVDIERGFDPGIDFIQGFENGIIFRDSDGKTNGKAYVMFGRDHGSFVREAY